MAKKTRSEVIKFISKHSDFVRKTELFGYSKGGILLSADFTEVFKGLPLYDYDEDDGRFYDMGVNTAWEKELNKRGWYSEWYDPGTIIIWPLDEEGWVKTYANPSAEIGGAVIAAAVLGYVLGKK